MRMFRMIISAAVAALAIGSETAKAALIPLVYENGPKIGQAYAGGKLTFQLTAYEVGTLYNSPYATGTNIGYTGVPSTSGVNSGVTTLDGQPSEVGAANAQARGQYAGASSNLEDGWGIFEVNNIKDASGFNLFTPAGKGEQLTGIFYGEQDFYLNQTNSTTQSISGAGLQADFYLSPTQNFDPTPGTAGRTASNTYAGVTSGSLVMHIASVPGFINGPGTLGGTATEFQSSYNYADGTGRGQAFANVAPGSQEYSVLHTQSFSSNYGFGNADLNFDYTSTPAAISNWLVQANDPITGYAAVPEPVGLGAIAVAGMALLGRRKRVQA